MGSLEVMENGNAVVWPAWWVAPSGRMQRLKRIYFFTLLSVLLTLFLMSSNFMVEWSEPAQQDHKLSQEWPHESNGYLSFAHMNRTSQILDMSSRSFGELEPCVLEGLSKSARIILKQSLYPPPYWTAKSTKTERNVSCRLPTLNPFHSLFCPNMLRLPSYAGFCSNGAFSFVDQEGLLHIRVGAFSSFFNPRPCFYQCFQSGDGDDEPLRFSRKTYIADTGSGLAVPDCQFVYVQCRSGLTPSTVLYHNVHFNAHGATTMSSSDVAYTNDKLPGVSKRNHIKPSLRPLSVPYRTSREQSSAGAKKLSVLILILDGLPLGQVLRQMPLTYTFLMETGAFLFKGYNILGGSTFPNLVPLLTGQHASDMRKLNDNARSYHDPYPMIWKNFSRSGFVTIYSEESSSYATFKYMSVGFKRQPTNYYMDPFWRLADEVRPNSHCMPDRATHRVMFENIRAFAGKHARSPHFGLFFLNSLTHESSMHAQNADADLLELFQYLVKTSNDTLLIFMSDHGDRFSELNKHLAGRLETRLPPLFLLFPQWFHEKYPQLLEAVRYNTRLLTTHYDLHATLEDVLHLDDMQNTLETHKENTHSLSFLKKIPTTRTCETAKVPLEYCVCNAQLSDASSVAGTSAQRQLLAESGVYARAAMDHVNRLVDQKAPGLCNHLSVAGVQQAYAMESDNGGKGCIDRTVVFTAKPGGASLEAVVRRCANRYAVIGQVLRRNLYGSQSRCVHDKSVVHLCYCLWSSWLASFL